MTNEEKAKETAEEYRAVLAANTDFDVNDLDLAEEDITKLTLDMAEWKDQRFKEYLEKKKEENNEKMKKYILYSESEEYYHNRVMFCQEIINELFPKTEQDNSDNDE